MPMDVGTACRYAYTSLLLPAPTPVFIVCLHAFRSRRTPFYNYTLRYTISYKLAYIYASVPAPIFLEAACTYASRICIREDEIAVILITRHRVPVSISFDLLHRRTRISRRTVFPQISRAYRAVRGTYTYIMYRIRTCISIGGRCSREGTNRDS